MCLFLACLWVFGCASSGGSQKPDCLGEIRTFNQGLIQKSPSQAATKFRKMQRSIQAFNRGLNHLFYRYAQSVGLPDSWLGPNSGQILLHGDYHVENIGSYKNAEGKIVVDLIDFDDSFQGPALLDIYRCASSLYLIASSDYNRERLVKAFVDAYADTMQKIAGKEMSADLVLDENSEFGLVRTLIQEASAADVPRFFTDFARIRVEEGKRVFVVSQDYERAPEDLAKALMRSYLQGRSVSGREYDIQDAVIERGSGVGSAGTFKVRVLVQGPTTDPSDDILLEFKEEIAPAGQMFCSRQYSDQGQRVWNGQRVMQTTVPPALGAARLGKKQFFVSELGPFYQELEWNKLVGPTQMREAATLAGVLLAKGHARSDAGRGVVALEISGLIENDRAKFLNDVRRFCEGYDAFLKKGYERFSQELTVSPLLFILWRGFLTGFYD